MCNAAHHQLNNSKPATLPPLRVAGVNHYFGAEMTRLMAAYGSAGDPLWSHFPNIAADLTGPGRNENDPLIDVRQLGLHTPPTTDGNPIRSSKPRGAPVEELQTAARLWDYFHRATTYWEKVEYFTPAQLLWVAVESCQEDGGSTLRAAGTLNDVTSLAPYTATLEAQNRVKELLYMMRELCYLSMACVKQMPACRIALSGRPTAELPSPEPYTEADPPLDLGPTVPKTLRQIDLRQPMHIMGVGATGTGKTSSLMVPGLRAFISYQLSDAQKSAAFIVDPKRELAHITERFLAERDEQERMFLAGRDGRLRLFPVDTPLSLRDRVTLIFEALDVHTRNKGDSASWIQKSLALLIGLVEAHAIMFNMTGRDLFVDLMLAAGRRSSRTKGYWFALRDTIQLLQEGSKSICWMHQRLCALATSLKLEADQLSVFQFLGRYASMDAEGANQISYVTGNLEGALTTLCDETLTSWIDLSPVPEMECADTDRPHDLSTLIDASRVIVFQPTDSPSGDVCARLLKAQFYRVAMQRRNLRQPVLFLCDEFQRFITIDRRSGEAGLLDRCRAYRITVILATQSITALYDALAKTGEAGNPEHAVGSILSNIAYMFYFQTPDRVSTEALQRSLPGMVRPGWAHPLAVVPLATLRVGEAYYIAPGSRWGRAQFQPGMSAQRS